MADHRAKLIAGGVVVLLLAALYGALIAGAVILIRHFVAPGIARMAALAIALVALNVAYYHCVWKPVYTKK